MARHSKIPKTQRPDLVLAVLRGTEKVEVLARRHQVSGNTLRQWRDKFLAGGRDRLTQRPYCFAEHAFGDEAGL